MAAAATSSGEIGGEHTCYEPNVKPNPLAFGRLGGGLQFCEGAQKYPPAPTLLRMMRGNLSGAHEQGHDALL